MVKVKLKIEGRGNFWINWCLPHSFISSMALKLIQAVMKSLINEWKKGFSSHSWQRSFTVPFTNPFSHTHKPTLHNLSPTDLLNLWKHPERDCQSGGTCKSAPSCFVLTGVLTEGILMIPSWQKSRKMIVSSQKQAEVCIRRPCKVNQETPPSKAVNHPSFESYQWLKPSCSCRFLQSLGVD